MKKECPYDRENGVKKMIYPTKGETHEEQMAPNFDNMDRVGSSLAGLQPQRGKAPEEPAAPPPGSRARRTATFRAASGNRPGGNTAQATTLPTPSFQCRMQRSTGLPTSATGK